MDKYDEFGCPICDEFSADEEGFEAHITIPAAFSECMTPEEMIRFLLKYCENLDEHKQDKLVPGDNITIVDNVISATGGGGGSAIDDNVISRNTTWSSKKISDEITPIQNISATIRQTSEGAVISITDKDGTVTTAILTNGKDGKDGKDSTVPGPAGSDGVDGVSPTVNIETIMGGHKVEITDKDGSHTFDVMNGENGQSGEDGFSPEIVVADVEGGHKVTVIDKSGTQEFYVLDGEGKKGDPGYSPTVEVTEIEGGHKVEITDKDGSHTFDVMNGENGQSGEDGFSPEIVVADVEGGHKVTVIDKSGTQEFYVLDGEGKKGDPGYSPTVEVTEIEGGHKVTISDETGNHDFDVMNGVKGDDGFTPTFNIIKIPDGYRIVITDAEGPHAVVLHNGDDGAPGIDGVSPTVSVETEGDMHVVTITDKDGAHEFVVQNGLPGTDGKDSTVPGPAGSDGVSPTVTVTDITDGHRVVITDKDGSHTFDVLNGENGSGLFPEYEGSIEFIPDDPEDMYSEGTIKLTITGDFSTNPLDEHMFYLVVNSVASIPLTPYIGYWNLEIKVNGRTIEPPQWFESSWKYNLRDCSSNTSKFKWLCAFVNNRITRVDYNELVNGFDGYSSVAYKAFKYYVENIANDSEWVHEQIANAGIPSKRAVTYTNVISNMPSDKELYDYRGETESMTNNCGIIYGSALVNGNYVYSVNLRVHKTSGSFMKNETVVGLSYRFVSQYGSDYYTGYALDNSTGDRIPIALHVNSSYKIVIDSDPPANCDQIFISMRGIGR